MSLPLASLDGTFFSARGRRFIPVGAHWVPAKAGLQWPLQWYEDELRADFSKMRDLGFNTVRFDLFWAWFEPRPGDYNPEAFGQLDALVHLAHEYQIYLHPTLFIGGEVGEAFWDVPWRQGRHPHADPEMLRLQTDHAAEFARRYQNEPAILAWDLTDEPPYWIVADQTTDAMAINWTRLISGGIRRSDGLHPLCVGTSMEDLNHGPFRPDNLAGEVDFFSVHPYSIYALNFFPDPMLSERATYAAAFETTLSLGAGKPVLIHEFGASSAQYEPERIASFDRVTLHSGLGAGACGFLGWCYTDAAPELFRQAPYQRAPHETQFGLTTWDRQDRPRGRVLRDFSRVLARIELENLQLAPREAALIIPDEWAKPYGSFARLGLKGPGAIPYTSTQDGFDTSDANHWLMGSLLSAFVLSHRAGWNVAMPREYTDWKRHSVVLLPSPLTSTERNLVHVHTTFWNDLRTYLREGGAVYASLCADAAIPGMAEIFGASLVDHSPTEEAVLTIVAPFGDLSPGAVFRYHPDARDPRQWPTTLDVQGGEIIAVDPWGLPALVAHRYGRGRSLLSAYPIETYLAATPSAFEGDELSHQIYRALGQWAGVTPLFAADDPSVEVSAWIGRGSGYAILANHRPESRTVTVAARTDITAAALVTADGKRPLPVAGRSWQMELTGYGGAIVEWHE